MIERGGYLSRSICGIERGRCAGVAAVDALVWTGAGSSEMSGFVVISRKQARSFLVRQTGVQEAFPTSRLSPPQARCDPVRCPRLRCSPIECQEVSNRSCCDWLACIPTTPIGKSRLSVKPPFEPHTVQPTIWTTSHNGQHPRHVIRSLDQTSMSCARVPIADSPSSQPSIPPVTQAGP
jgi:hypothetical protein